MPFPYRNGTAAQGGKTGLMEDPGGRGLDPGGRGLGPLQGNDEDLWRFSSQPSLRGSRGGSGDVYDRQSYSRNINSQTILPLHDYQTS